MKITEKLIGFGTNLKAITILLKKWDNMSLPSTVLELPKDYLLKVIIQKINVVGKVHVIYDNFIIELLS